MVGANLINKCRILAQPDVDIFLCILKQHGTSRLFWVFGTATIGVVGGMQIHDFGVRNIEMEAAQFAAFTHSLDTCFAFPGNCVIEIVHMFNL